MPVKNILVKYEKILVLVLLAVSVTLATALAFIWWQVLSVKPASKPGDFLKINWTK